MMNKLPYLIIAAIFAVLMIPIMMIPAQAAVEVGNQAPNFTATDVYGESFDLSAHKGKTVILEWTNHHCPYVIKHYDSGNMQKTIEEAKAMGDVEWVTIVSSAPGKQGNVSPEEAIGIMKSKSANPTTKILDESGEIGQLFGAKTTPHMFVIDPNGTLIYAGAIDDNPSPRQSSIEGAQNYVLSALNDLKAGNAVQVASTQPYGCSVKYDY